MTRPFLRSVLCILAMLFLVAWMPAQSKHERTQFNNDLHVDEDESTGEVTCIHCSIYIRGQVTGDATAFLGQVVLEPNASVSGDATSIAGNIRLASGTKVGGDATAIGGSVQRDPQASVGGDIDALAGGAWILLIFLVPVLVLGGIVALVVWLVQKGRHPAQMPVRSL
jgi:hypothetical protein